MYLPVTGYGMVHAVREIAQHLDELVSRTAIAKPEDEKYEKKVKKIYVRFVVYPCSVGRIQTSWLCFSIRCFFV